MLTKEDILSKPRSQIRYWLYRIRTAVENEEDIPVEALELKEYFEAQEGFEGWIGFARTWDVGREGYHYKIVKRRIPEETEWMEIVRTFMRELELGSVRKNNS